MSTLFLNIQKIFFYIQKIYSDSPVLRIQAISVLIEVIYLTVNGVAYALCNQKTQKVNKHSLSAFYESFPFLYDLFRYGAAGYTAIHGQLSDPSVGFLFGNMLMLHHKAFGLAYDPQLLHLILHG